MEIQIISISGMRKMLYHIINTLIFIISIQEQKVQ